MTPTDARRTVIQVLGGSPKKKGSLEEYFLRLALQLRQEGFDSVFVFNHEPEPYLAGLYRDVGAKLVVIADSDRKFDLVAIRRLYLFFKESRPSLINFHFGTACANGLVAARLAGIKNTLWTKHSFYAEGPFYRKVSHIKLLTSMILFQGILAKRLIAVSDGVKQELLSYHLPVSKISRIYLGVNQERFRCSVGLEPFSQGIDINEGDRIVACISQARPEKGLEYLIRALPLVVQRFPNIKLLLVGGGPLTQSLMLLAGELGVSHHVCFCGVRNDVEKIISNSEFTVLPSLTEGISLALIESQSSGKPVIASSVGGIPEVITDNVNGLLVPPSDVNRLAECIILLLQNGELRRRMGAAAVEKAKIFDVNVGVAATLKLYQEMMNSHV